MIREVGSLSPTYTTGESFSLEVIVPKNLQLFLGIIYRFQGQGTQVTNPCQKTHKILFSDVDLVDFLVSTTNTNCLQSIDSNGAKTLVNNGRFQIDTTSTWSVYRISELNPTGSFRIIFATTLSCIRKVIPDKSMFVSLLSFSLCVCVCFF